MAGNIKGLGIVKKFLATVGKPTELKLGRVLIAGGNAIQKIARENAPIDQGGLRNSIISTKNFAPDELEVEVGPTVLYAPFIEFGTKAHFPPVEPIERWAQRHGMPGAGFAIARKIASRPTKARPFLIPAFNKVAPKVFKKLNKVIQGID